MQVQEQIHALFGKKTIEKLCSTIRIEAGQEQASLEWLSKLESGELDKEKKNYFKFAIIVLKNILGYDINKDMDFEEANVEFSFRDHSTNKSVCIEVKGTATKDLFAVQNREKPEHQTPIKQTWDYMGASNFDYGIATNYRDFVLIDKSKGYSRYHLFDFESIRENPLRLKEFIAVFSRESILENSFIMKLHEESVVEEREFTKEFYKLYHETRLMLVKEYQQNGQISKDQAVHYAQLVLNRLIFTFFAEDTGKLRKRLFSDSILQSLNPILVSEYSRYVSDTILNLFVRLDKGSYQPIEIFGFNGGLFREVIPNNVYFNDLKDHSFFKDVLQYSTLKQNIAREDLSQKIAGRFGGSLNPIINNLLIMSSFDFQTEMNVNILGHIFEQSLTDLEELLDSTKKSTRKKEGIFYTPEYITEYICRNTILPWLSKDGATSSDELIAEYSNDLDTLEQKFQTIKVLDPACGSGAFLLKAVDILLDVHKKIREVKESQGRYTVIKKGKHSKTEIISLAKWNEEEEARKIIENNIFGVDINEESVQITKLSLFLRIAANNRKLLDLSRNIKRGNSLITSKSIDPLAFDWREEFKDILNNGGFDVIIGNPPYVRMEEFKSLKTYLKNTFSTHGERSDLYVYFYEQAHRLLRHGGRLGFISSNTFLKTEYGTNLRRFLREETEIQRVLNLGETQFFEGATTYPVLLFFKKAIPSPNHKFEYFDTAQLRILDFPEKVDDNLQSMIQEDLGDDVWTFESPTVKRIMHKLEENTVSLREYCGSPLMGIKTGLNEAFVIDENQRSELVQKNAAVSDIIKPFLMGKDLQRWHTPAARRHIIYSPHGMKMENYPKIKEHLLQFKDELSKRATKQNWWELQQPQSKYVPLMEKEKIIFVDIASKPTFSLDNEKNYLANSVYFLPTNDKYLLCLLNSNLSKWFIFSSSRRYRGGYVTFRGIYVERIPVKKISDDLKTRFSEYADAAITLSKKINNTKTLFLNRVKSNFLLEKMPSKLESFWNLQFSDFYSEIRKNVGNELSLKQQDEWEEYFEGYKRSMLKLLRDIEGTESEINALIYEIYGLKEDERQLIDQAEMH